MWACLHFENVPARFFTSHKANHREGSDKTGECRSGNDPGRTYVKLPLSLILFAQAGSVGVELRNRHVSQVDQREWVTIAYQHTELLSLRVLSYSWRPWLSLLLSSSLRHARISRFRGDNCHGHATHNTFNRPCCRHQMFKHNYNPYLSWKKDTN